MKRCDTMCNVIFGTSQYIQFYHQKIVFQQGNNNKYLTIRNKGYIIFYIFYKKKF